MNNLYRHLILTLALCCYCSAVWGQTSEEPPADEGSETPASDKSADPAAESSEPKADEPKTDEPKTDEPKTDKPKADETGAESPADAEKSDASDTNAAAESAKDDAASAIAEDLKADRFNDTPTLSEFRDEVRAFEKEYAEIRADIDRFVSYQREQRLSEVEAKYQRVIDQLSARERQRRDDAIAQFERFVKRYPSEAKYTPSALLRLAQLHYERAEDIYFLETEKYDRQMALFDEEKIDQAPEQPMVNYIRTIQLFGQLIRDWPNSKMLDGAYYMQGYCLSGMEQDEKAQENFQVLVEKYPESIFAQESWWRIGEYHFDAGQLEKAITAYKKVIEDKEGRFYDKGLYKLAWSFFRDDRYPLAIKRFTELLLYSEALKKKEGRESDLVQESIQYLAISLQEEDWDDDGEPDEDAGLARLKRYLEEGHTHEAKVIKAIVSLLFDNARYEDMVTTARYYMERYPNDSENPMIHDQLINALSRLRLYEEAFQEREVFARRYGKNSSWYAANQDNDEAIDQATVLVETALITSAQKFLRDARKAEDLFLAGDASKEAEAIALYTSAADAYRRYLKQFPRSKNAYDLKFFLAECLYGSRQLDEAAISYVEVVQDKSNDRHLEKASWLAALTREELVKTMARNGEVEATRSIMGDEYEEPEKTDQEQTENDNKLITIEPRPIPPVIQELIDARLVYVNLDPKYRNAEKPEQLTEMIFKVGDHYYDYKHYDEARKRFVTLIETYPKAKVTKLAAGRLIDSYRDTNDWKNLAMWAERIDKLDFGKEFGAELRTLQVGALFQSATLLFEAGEYQKAADEYIRLVNENPKAPDSASALNNAAVAYEKLRKFESAGKAYQRIVNDYPKSEFVEDALYNLAKSYNKVFEYEQAIRTYSRLFSEFPSSKNRADYLYLVANNLEKTGQYRKAARRYEEYARVFPNREDTAETYFKSATLYKRLKDDRNLDRTYKEFFRRYANDPEQNPRLLESLLGQARLLKKRNRVRQAKAKYEEVINEFNARGLEPGSQDAQYPAEAAFELVEYDFVAYEKLQIKGRLEKQGEIIQKLKKNKKELKRKYNEVLGYKFLDWMIAALYRIGHLEALFAQKLYDVALPDSMNEDQQDEYRGQLDEAARPYEDRATANYEFAIKEARKNSIMTAWTEQIQSALNESNPEDYPLFKTEVRPNAAQHLSNPFAFPSSPKTPDADAKPEAESTGQVEAQSPAAPVSENLESKTSPEDVPSEPSETKAPSEGAAP